MVIADFIKNSFVDFPGKVSTVVFTQACNMNCFYCYNKELIPNKKTGLDDKEIFKFLRRRKDLIDAVVITGGEPTLHKGLTDFIIKIKEEGFLIKLDTNGTNPEVIRDLIENDYIDYCAMDIKSTFDKYKDVCRSTIDIEDIKESIRILLNSKIKYEFRTTCYPKITREDIFKIMNLIKGADYYALQKYKDFEKITNNNFNLLEPELLNELNQKEYIKHIQYRG
jgi:pyruvate formate lyase activating enzyme